MYIARHAGDGMPAVIDQQRFFISNAFSFAVERRQVFNRQNHFQGALIRRLTVPASNPIPGVSRSAR